MTAHRSVFLAVEQMALSQHSLLFPCRSVCIRGCFGFCTVALRGYHQLANAPVREQILIFVFSQENGTLISTDQHSSRAEFALIPISVN